MTETHTGIAVTDRVRARVADLLGGRDLDPADERLAAMIRQAVS